MAIQNYKYDFLAYYANDAVKSNCGDITFYNQGSTNVTINATLILRPGSSLNLSGNAGERDLTIYNFSFEQNPALQNNLVVIRKIFF